MHQARKLYHRLIWSVGVLEKAVLRWRQRGKGLRGYQVEAKQVKSNDFLMIGRKQAEDSVERAAVLVQSMVKSGSAREQYKRMQENFKQALVSHGYTYTFKHTNAYTHLNMHAFILDIYIIYNKQHTHTSAYIFTSYMYCIQNAYYVFSFYFNINLLLMCTYTLTL